MRRLLLLVPLLLVGCGSHHDFASQGDAICRDVTKKVNALPRPAQLSDIGSYVQKASAIERDGLQRLRDLKPPAKLRPAVAAYETLIAHGIDLTVQIGAAAARNDAARQQQLNQQTATFHAQATAAARKVGFKDCSK